MNGEQDQAVSSIEELVRSVLTAGEEFSVREQQAKVADRVRESAREKLNCAQAALDAYYLDMRKKAPWNTRWWLDRDKAQLVTGSKAAPVPTQ